jgi:hypothetical protein
MLASALAQLTEGVVYSDDDAWNYELMPATYDEFNNWYLRPERALIEEDKETASLCLEAIAKEILRFDLRYCKGTKIGSDLSDQ